MGFIVYKCHPEERGISIQIPHFDCAHCDAYRRNDKLISVNTRFVIRRKHTMVGLIEFGAEIQILQSIINRKQTRYLPLEGVSAGRGRKKLA